MPDLEVFPEVCLGLVFIASRSFCLYGVCFFVLLIWFPFSKVLKIYLCKFMTFNPKVYFSSRITSQDKKCSSGGTYLRKPRYWDKARMTKTRRFFCLLWRFWISWFQSLLRMLSVCKKQAWLCVWSVWRYRGRWAPAIDLPAVLLSSCSTWNVFKGARSWWRLTD